MALASDGMWLTRRAGKGSARMSGCGKLDKQWITCANNGLPILSVDVSNFNQEQSNAQGVLEDSSVERGSGYHPH